MLRLQRLKNHQGRAEEGIFGGIDESQIPGYSVYIPRSREYIVNGSVKFCYDCNLPGSLLDQAGASAKELRTAHLSSYEHLIGKNHIDPDDGLLYKTVKVAEEKVGGRGYLIVGYRSRLYPNGKLGKPERESIHIEDIAQMTTNTKTALTNGVGTMVPSQESSTSEAGPASLSGGDACLEKRCTRTCQNENPQVLPEPPATSLAEKSATSAKAVQPEASKRKEHNTSSALPNPSVRLLRSSAQTTRRTAETYDDQVETSRGNRRAEGHFVSTSNGPMRLEGHLTVPMRIGLQAAEYVVNKGFYPGQRLVNRLVESEEAEAQDTGMLSISNDQLASVEQEAARGANLVTATLSSVQQQPDPVSRVEAMREEDAPQWRIAEERKDEEMASLSRLALCYPHR